MKATRFFSFLALAALLLGMLSACSAPEPVTIDKLPVYSTAKVSTNADYVKIIQAGADQITNNKDVFTGVETKVYAAPMATKWEDVSKSFDEQLSKDSWKTDSSLSYDESTVHVKAWTRGKQMVAIVYVSMTGLNDVVLGTLLATMK